MNTNFDPLPRKAEMAFIEYLRRNAPPAIAGLHWYPLNSNEPNQNPRGIAECKSCTDRPRMVGRGVYDATLALWVVSHAEDDSSAVHEARVGAVLAAINDKRGVKAALNAPRAGMVDARQVRDFHVYEYFLKKMDNSRAENKWIGEVELHLVCQGMDIVI